ncbi:MAG: methyltransferase domain-containing protein [Eubacteriales bacterium]|nr:methyltransferase domain-containing protein [Eubacteriales bacterium]
MRMYQWTDDMIRLMHDASERTDFYALLARQIVQALGGEARAAPMRLCDAGCGLGYLSLELARCCQQVTAVDVSAPSLEVLRQNLESRRIANVEPLRMSVWDMPRDMRFDAMVFCLFGQVDEVLRAARGHCGQAVIVKKTWTTRRFALKPDVPERDTLDETTNLLEQNGLAFTRSFVSLTLDQPFRCIEDAMLFFRLYGHADAETEVNEQEVRRRLTETGDPEFPWLLPVPKRLGVLTVNLS